MAMNSRAIFLVALIIALASVTAIAYFAYQSSERASAFLAEIDSLDLLEIDSKDLSNDLASAAAAPPNLNIDERTEAIYFCYPQCKYPGSWRRGTSHRA